MREGKRGHTKTGIDRDLHNSYNQQDVYGNIFREAEGVTAQDCPPRISTAPLLPPSTSAGWHTLLHLSSFSANLVSWAKLLGKGGLSQAEGLGTCAAAAVCPPVSPVRLAMPSSQEYAEWKQPTKVLEGCYKVSPEPSLLQAEQPQLSQPVFTGEVLQPSDHLCGPLLDSLQQLHVLLTLGTPELNAVVQMVSRISCSITFPGIKDWLEYDIKRDKRGHRERQMERSTAEGWGLIYQAHDMKGEHCEKGEVNCPGWVASKTSLLHETLSETPELDAVLQPGYSWLSGLQALAWTLDVASSCPVFIHHYHQVLFRRAALNPFILQSVLILGIALTQVQDLALGLVELHDVHMGPVLKPVKVPLDGIPSLKRIKCTTQLGVICRLSEGSSYYLQMISMLPNAFIVGWRLNHFPGQPVPMLDNPLGEEKFPHIQSKPPLAQLEAISSCPITCYLGEETDPHLSTTSFQAKQSQLPQPLLIRLLLQTLHQLRCPSLHPLQYLNIPLVVGGPKLNTVFEVRPHQCRVQGHNHFPSRAGHAIFDTSQDAIGFLGRLGTLLAHIQAAVNKHAQVLLCQAAFQPLFPKPVALHGVAVAQVQDLALGLVKPHTIDLGPSIQPVQVPLQSLPTLQQINTPTQLGVICKLTESALDPFVQIIDKDVKQNWPQHRALGNTACDRPPTGVNSIHHHSLGPAVQPVLYPAKSTPVQGMSSQFLQENAVGDRVKGFTEV
ncbi:hypothetical protein QYF61_006032 [Mycteria americana]|uniref:Uncharacterized protein n=1 Tax=Mycteria americana TaxID=33587 RepID=A0AAN7NHP3_MYCAM|nr:hypothetical protein QYF61_006032 [Mycteria americana]